MNYFTLIFILAFTISAVIGQYDEVEIPVEITHSVEAIEDSLCILSQGE